MKPILFYLLQMLITSGLLYGYYHFVLRNKKFHLYNRFYLLAATIISIIIPFLNIPLYFTVEEKSSSIVIQTLSVISPVYDTSLTYLNNQQNVETWFSVESCSYLFYITIALLALIRIFFSLYKIKRIVTKYPVEKINKIYFINTVEPGTPFSFFRWLFWNQKIALNSKKGEQIFRHELYHIKQKHSLDSIYIELLTVIFWINPFFHLFKKELKALHEFLADEFAITGNDQLEYAELLLMQAFNTNHRLVNPFFHNQIKRRIAMITSSKKTSYQYLRKLMVLPVTAIVIGLFAFTYKQKKGIEKENFIPEEKITGDTTAKPKSHKIEWIELFIPKEEKIPTIDQLKTWTDTKTYGVWLDGKRINNTTLSKYKPAEFSLYSVSKLAKNTVNYGNHFYQVNLFSNHYYEKLIKNKQLNNGKYIIISDTTAPESLLGERFKNSSIVIDGKIGESLNSIKVNEILSFTILKGQDAIKKYGDFGKNGVVEIITTKGTSAEIISEKETVISKNDLPSSRDKTEPSFPNGDAEWRKYLAQNLDASVPRKHNAPERAYTTVVEFTVDKQGNVTNVKPLTNQDYGMEKEAVRVIKAGPKWSPALLNGQPVSSFKKQVITFMVVNGDKQIPKVNNNTSNEYNEVVVISYPFTKNKIEQKPVTNRDIIFEKVEIEPTFPGGETKWKQYLSHSLNENIPIEKGAPAGSYSVCVEFIVKTDGFLTNIKALTKHGYGMEDEALRIIKKGPKWIPAIQNGISVVAYKKQIITFNVNNKITESIAVEFKQGQKHDNWSKEKK